MPSKPPLNNLPGRAGAGTCPNLLQRRSAARSAARRSAEYQRSFSGAPARFGSLQQIWTTCRRGSSGEGGHGADDDHDGRTDGRTGPARTRPGLAGGKEPGCKEPCQSLGRVGRRLAPARSRPKLVRPARPMRLGWARFIPCGARPGQEMALWEDHSAPHSTMLPSEPRNHAETPGRIRGADPNDPPRAPEPRASGVRAPVDAADPADAIPAGPAAGAGVHPARGRSLPLGPPPPSSPRRRG